MLMSHVSKTGQMRRIGCYWEWCTMEWNGKAFYQKKDVIGMSGGSIGTIE